MIYKISPRPSLLKRGREKAEMPHSITRRAKKDNLFRMILLYKLVNDSLDLFLKFPFCNHLSIPLDNIILQCR